MTTVRDTVRDVVRDSVRDIDAGLGGNGAAGIEILSSTASGTASTASPLTITVPVGVADGMELLLYIFVREDSDLITGPAGFTEIANLTIASASGDDRRGEVWQRTASSEPASYDIIYTQATGRQMVAIMLAVSGLDAAVFDVTPTTAHRAVGDNNNNPDTITITTITAGAIVLNGICTTQPPSIAVGEPSGNTLIATDDTTNFMGAVSFVAPAIGAVAAIPWNNTAANVINETITNVIALRPAA